VVTYVSMTTSGWLSNKDGIDDAVQWLTDDRWRVTDDVISELNKAVEAPGLAPPGARSKTARFSASEGRRRGRLERLEGVGDHGAGQKRGCQAPRRLASFTAAAPQ
jgi:hypothetical protein